MAVRLLDRWCLLTMIGLTGAVGLWTASPVGARQGAVRHELTVTGRDGQFIPARIEVGAGDILRITLVADRQPCSFAIDAYRISKRATPDHPTVFEFRADRTGRFPYYCDLTTDEACRHMRGELVVDGR